MLPMLFSPKISMDDKIRKAREETEKKDWPRFFFRPATFTFEELARTEKKLKHHENRWPGHSLSLRLREICRDRVSPTFLPHIFLNRRESRRIGNHDFFSREF